MASIHMTDERAVWLVVSPRPSASPQSGKAEELGWRLASGKPGAGHASEPPSRLSACEGCPRHMLLCLVDCGRLTTRMHISCCVSPSSFTLQCTAIPSLKSHHAGFGNCPRNAAIARSAFARVIPTTTSGPHCRLWIPALHFLPIPTFFSLSKPPQF